MYLKLRDLRLCAYLADNYKERKDAREIYMDLTRKYSESGFSGPNSIGNVIPRFCHQVIRNKNEVNEYIC